MKLKLMTSKLQGTFLALVFFFFFGILDFLLVEKNK